MPWPQETRSVAAVGWPIAFVGPRRATAHAGVDIHGSCGVPTATQGQRCGMPDRRDSREPDDGSWLRDNPLVIALGVVATLIAGVVGVLDALASRNGQIAAILVAGIVALLLLDRVRRRVALPGQRHAVTATMVLALVSTIGVPLQLVLRDAPDASTKAITEELATGSPATKSEEVEPAIFTIDDLRLARWQDRGADIGLGLRGGEQAAYVVRLDILQIAEVPECGGPGPVDAIRVEAAAGLKVEESGGTLLVAEQRSAGSPGSTVQVEGEKESSRCTSRATLKLRPQQGLAAEELGQLRLLIPASYAIAEILYSSPESGKTRPAQDVLNDPNVALPESEQQNLERLLGRADYPLFLWPWAEEFDPASFGGWEFVLLVAATLSDDSCAVHGIDLLADGARLDKERSLDLLERYGTLPTPGACA